MIDLKKLFRKVFPFNNPFNIKKINISQFNLKRFNKLPKLPSIPKIPGIQRFKLKDKKSFWRKFRFWGIRFAIGLGIVIFLLFAWFAKDLPTPGNIKRRQAVASTQLFDRNGKPIYAVHGDIKRTLVDSKEIPDSIKKATITAEDRSFYHHLGINLKGILRAAYYNITNKTGYVSGGSTITQQYVKNALLDPKKTFTRKIKELILAFEIEVMYSKDDILTMYLNEIPYGSNAYGVQAAAKTFFNKDAKDLTLAESATLAALPQRPTYYSPYGTHPDKRLLRTNWILDSMADLKYISRGEAEKAKMEAKDIKFAEPREYIVAPHFAMYVKEALVEKYGEQLVEEGGLKVTTTLDLDKQKKAEEAVEAGAGRRFDNINASNAALVSIEPKTGQVVSMVGSVDFFNKDIDGQVNVADSERQPGSAFKPLVYATAFKGQYNPGYTLWDVTTDFGNYTPKNYDGTAKGPVSMRSALANSLNISAVKTLYLAGIENSLRTAHNMGITTLNDKDRYGLSLVLGGGEVKLIDLTTAYGVFANEGKLAQTTVILKVEDSNGKVLEEYKDDKNEKEVLDPQIAYEMSSILADNDARTPVFGPRSALHFPDRPIAAKTGTTSEYKDAWTVGYTPSVVTGVWVGNNDSSPMAQGAAGAMAAAPIWHQYMESVLEGTPVEDFNRPEGIQEITVDKFSNKLPTQSSPETVKDIFASWQVPKDKDDIHIAIRVDKFSGKRATEDCPDVLTEMRTFTNLHSEVPDNPSWEYPVRAAAERYGIYVSYPPEETSCVGLSGQPTVKITAPSDKASVSGGFTISAKASSGAGISKVDFYSDGVLIGSDNNSPYSISAPGLSSGKHKISAVASNEYGLTATNEITVTVARDSSIPGKVTNLNIDPGNNSISASWRNPNTNDLESVRIYGSTTRGQLGSLLTTISVNPATTSSVTLNGLENNRTYWLTFRTVDFSGNENNDSTQYSARTN